MGTVFETERLDDKKGKAGLEQVALKTVTELDPESVAGLHREMRLLERLRHRGVVRLIEHGLDHGRPWYTMTRLPGRSFATLLDQLWGCPETETDAVTAAVTAATDAGPTSQMLPGTTGMATYPYRHRMRLQPEEEKPQIAAGNLSVILEVTIGLCQTLSYLHGEGVVHLDLKPSNILLDPQGRPILIDFGVTRRFAGGLNRETLSTDVSHGGTETYMAPEQIQGGSPDARADLYALGCMLYEGLTGRPPFLQVEGTTVWFQHLTAEVTSPAALVSEVPDELEALVLRLLAKEPQERSGYAEDVASALKGFLPAGHWLSPQPIGSKTLPSPSSERDSAQRAIDSPAKPYLYRPAFVGRQQVLEALVELSLRSKEEGGQFAALIAESGGGRTRLATELARRVLDEDMMVAVGACRRRQGEDFEGATGALQAFRPLLRTLAEQCRDGGPHFTRRLFHGTSGDAAQILSVFEPSLASLQTQVAPHHDVHSEYARGRVRAAMVQVLVQASRDNSLLLVLDDIQWADDLTLAVLEVLVEDTSWQGMLLLSVRSDEVNERVSQLLAAPTVVRHRLEPFDDQEVEKLIGGMLAHQSVPTEILHFIGEHSLGRPFLVAEYLHAAVARGLLKRGVHNGWWFTLSASDRELSEVNIPLKAELASNMDLPTTVEGVLAMRLESMPAKVCSVLQIAAVIGSEFKRDFLNRFDIASIYMSENPGDADSLNDSNSIDAAIEWAVAHRVLTEQNAGAFEFEHQELREALYGGIERDTRIRAHKAVAEKYESLITQRKKRLQEVGLETASQLAYHHHEAQSMSQSYSWNRQAGLLALDAGAHRQARGLLRVAVECMQSLDEIPRWECSETMAALAMTCERTGQWGEAISHYRNAMALRGRMLPSGKRAWMLTAVSGFARVLLHALMPRRLRTARRVAQEQQNALAEISGRLVRCFIANNRALEMMAMLMVGVEAALRSGKDGALASMLPLAGAVAGFAGFNRVAERTLKEARHSAKRDGLLESEVAVAQVESFYYLNHCKWEQAKQSIQTANDQCLTQGKLHLAQPCLYSLALVAFMRGEYEVAHKRSEELRDLTRRTFDDDYHVLSRIMPAQIRLGQGNPRGALEFLEEVSAPLGRLQVLTNVVTYHTTFAAVLSALGLHRDAVARAEWTLELMKDKRIDSPLLFPLQYYLPEVFLRAWETSPNQISIRDRAEQMLQGAKRFSSVCPMAGPRMDYQQGLAAFHAGERKKALRLYRRSAHAASEVGLPLDEAKAAKALSQMSPLGEQERNAWAEIAYKKFRLLGNTTEAAAVRGRARGA